MKKLLLILTCIAFSINVNAATNVNAAIDFECEENDCRKNFKKIRKFAVNGSPEAQEILANFYSLGYGTKTNKKLAISWFKKAIKKGRFGAFKSLAKLYLKEGNIKLAIEYFSKAGNHGFNDSAYELGVLYGKGEIIELNYQKAEQWLMIAANRGHKESQNLLVEMYRTGLTSKNNKDVLAKYSDQLKQDNFEALETKTENTSNVEIIIASDNQYSNEMERIEVLYNMKTYISYTIESIKDLGLYDQGRGTGSRIQGTACDIASACSVIAGADRLTKLANAHAAFNNIAIMKTN